MWLTPAIVDDLNKLKIKLGSQHSLGVFLGYKCNKSRAAGSLLNGTRRMIRRDKYDVVVKELSKSKM